MKMDSGQFTNEESAKARLNAFSQGVREENLAEPQEGEEEEIPPRVTIHSSNEKPNVGGGVDVFNWWIEDPMVKIGYGGKFDIMWSTEYKKKPYWTDYDTY